MSDLYMEASIICFVLSSIRVGFLGSPLSEEHNVPRIADNFALVGKTIALLLCLCVAAIFANAWYLIPSVAYGFGLVLFTKKTKLKGNLWVWSSPYAMPIWEQRAINVSGASQAAAVSTLIANISIALISTTTYNNIH